ncbi:MAG TPA: DUF3501 family protein [Anaeromyxobacteraceae bacterium]|nr:DUF3501 family protein [Anaeromyxobacteraceae bacterium]
MRVERSEILGLGEYEAQREAIRARILGEKRIRRVHVGPVLTLLFENADTIRYQVQEMVRTERLTGDAEVRHELETYNELLGGPGELGCTLLIELDDPVERDARLREWRTLPEHLYVGLPGGRKARARYDRRQVGSDRLSAVQYLKFEVGALVPSAVGCDLPGLRAETILTAEQRQALALDLDDARVAVHGVEA